jgi:hypothetical protein
MISHQAIRDDKNPCLHGVMNKLRKEEMSVLVVQEDISSMVTALGNVVRSLGTTTRAALGMLPQSTIEMESLKNWCQATSSFKKSAILHGAYSGGKSSLVPVFRDTGC